MILLVTLLITLAISSIFMIRVGAQSPETDGDGQSSTPEEATATLTPSPEPEDGSSVPASTETPTTTLSASPESLPEENDNLEPILVTGSGRTESVFWPASNISALALTPVDCATLTKPVVGFEVSRGQRPDDVVDFLNDLMVNGFNLGTVDLSAGSIPPCVDVLIALGLSNNSFLTSPYYTAADGALLQTWTASGHSLMLLGDWGPFRAGTEALFQAYGYSQQGTSEVSDSTNFDAAGPANTWVIYQADNFAGHPILNGVTALELLASSSLSPNNGSIVVTDADAAPPTVPVLAAFTQGLGCVALTSDSNWVTQFDGGYFKQDNAKTARQMVQWLSSCSNLSLSKVASPNPVQAGGLLTYTLTVRNDTIAAVTNLLITDTVPASTTFVSASLPHTGPDANGVVGWPLAALDPNSSAIVVMVVQVNGAVPTGTLIANTAWLTSEQGLGDSATTLTPVNIQIADPVVTKAATPGQAQVGDVVTFTLTVQQAAPSTSNATNVQIVDPLPNEVDILSLEVSAGFTTVTGRVVTWTIPILTPGDVRSMTIQARVNNNASPAPLTFTNQASLSFDQGSNRLSNQAGVFVPAVVPPPPPPPPPAPPADQDDGDDDDNDNDNEAAPPPAAAPPAPAVASISAPTPTPALPVILLPETGNQAAWPALGGLALGLGLFSIIVIFSLKKRL